MIDTNDGTGGDREIEIEREDDRPSGDAGRSTTDGTRRATVGDRDAERSGVGGDERAPERRLEDELGRIDLVTTPEGYVEGRVSGLSAVDETTVRLAVTLPHDRTVTFDLEKPIPWIDEFLLVRIVEDVGYDAASVGHLVGETIYLARTDVGEGAADDSGGWWTTPVRFAGEAVLSSLDGRLRIEEDRAPEWRLVDPRERATDADDGSSRGTSATIAYALPGLLLVLIGLFAAFRRRGASG